VYMNKTIRFKKSKPQFIASNRGSRNWVGSGAS
jgi:hypothetical protein